MNGTSLQIGTIAHPPSEWKSHEDCLVQTCYIHLGPFGSCEGMYNKKHDYTQINN